MGRRAKNKQSAPLPLAEAAPNKPTAKKLGKRKADAENDGQETLSKRTAKKAREGEGKKVAKKGSAGELKKKAVKVEELGKKKTKPKVVEEEVEEEEQRQHDGERLQHGRQHSGISAARTFSCT